MRKIIINGGKPIGGTIAVSGAKNSVLPLIASTLLADGTCIIDDTPWLSDVDVMCQVLSHMGAKPRFDHGVLSIDTHDLYSVNPPGELVRKMRASFIITGPLLSRFGHAEMSLPGGCSIGARPIDLHLKGFEAMGAKITIGHDYIEATAKEGLRGAPIYLDFPSVGATENLMMAASCATGTTVINNAAREPEIVDLSNMLNAMGAKIKGAGTSVIRIEGVEQLLPARHTVIPDRIEAGSFMVLAAACGADLIITNIIPEHLQSVTAKLEEAGVSIQEGLDGIHICGSQDIFPIDVKTMPYPGFPTDMQAQMMAMLTLGKGKSIITETVFENRFMHVEELRRMGADITIDGHSAIINGVSHLHGAQVRATDLRGGAAMIIAGLIADGTTVIDNIHHIERGYDDICAKLTGIGADIHIEED